MERINDVPQDPTGTEHRTSVSGWSQNVFQPGEEFCNHQLPLKIIGFAIIYH